MTAATSPSKPRTVSLWRRPLLVGLCFGLGYGITQRLLDLRLPNFVSWGPSFDVREFPGTSLESLQLRHGSADHDLRGTAALLEPTPLNTPADTDANAAGIDASEPSGTGGEPDAEAMEMETGSSAGAPAAPKLPPPATPKLPPPAASQP